MPVNPYMQPDLASMISQPLPQDGQQQPDIVQQILSSRFQPNIDDIGNSAMAGIAGDTYTSPQAYTNDRISNAMKQLSVVANAQKDAAMANIYNQGGPGNATIKATQAIMAERPDLDFVTAFGIAKSGLGPGMTYGQGGVAPMPGAPQAQGAMAYGKGVGGEAAKLDYAAPIAAATEAGKGNISPNIQLGKGQSQVSKMIGGISSYYDELQQKGAAVSVANTPGENIERSVRGSGVGQFFGKMAGTEEQSVRNKINQAIPGLISAIRQATGMSAKAMDSNAELQFYLQQATNPVLDIEANKAALARIEQLYGLSSGIPGNQQQGGAVNLIPQQGEAPSQQRVVVKTQISPSTGKRKIIYSDGTEEVE